MISTIRNPWIRRPLVVLLGPPVMLMAMMCDLLAPLEEYLLDEFVENVRSYERDLVDAWHGRR